VLGGAYNTMTGFFYATPMDGGAATAVVAALIRARHRRRRRATAPSRIG
jgi:uncharacterized protein YoaH (UPF0181 family)